MKFDSSEKRSELPPDTLFSPESASSADLIAGPAAATEATSADDSAGTGKPRRRRGGRGRGGRGRGKSVRRKAPVPTAEPVAPTAPAPEANAILPAVYQPADAQQLLPESPESRAVDQPVPTISPAATEPRPEPGTPEDQRATPASGPSAPASGSTGSAGYSTQRPNPERLVARAAPRADTASWPPIFQSGKSAASIPPYRHVAQHHFQRYL